MSTVLQHLRYAGSGADGSHFFNTIIPIQNIYLKTAGKGYSLRFFGKTQLGVDFASVTSSSFDVVVGAPFKLHFKSHLGNAFGGTPFAENPSVAIVDRGENIVTTVDTGSMTVSLSSSPTGNEELRPVDRRKVSISKGLATFKDLFINEAGVPYQLQFSCDQVSFPSVFVVWRVSLIMTF